MEMSQQCGWDFSHEDDGTTVTVTATDSQGLKPPVRFIYTGVSQPRKSEVQLFTQFRILDASNAFEAWESVFDYRASVRQSDINPWIGTTRIHHGQHMVKHGIPEAVASVAFSYALPIVWAGVRQGLAEKHALKSQAKDKHSNNPNELF
jgi:hypothetical protein